MDKKFTILYVDDERGNLNAFKNAFRREYNILIADKPSEGLKILQDNKIDLILSDQRMPEMTGVEFLRQSKKSNPDPNRILVTAYSDFEAIQNAINDANIFKFVKKPWHPEQFKETLDHALEAYDLRQRNKALTQELSSKNAELKAANKELAESEQLKNDFLQIISHEMRTPLNGLKGATQLFKLELGIENSATDASSRRLYEILESSTTRLEHFLLLAERITSLKAGSYELKREAINISELIAQAISDLAKTAAQNGQTIEVSNCEDASIEADGDILIICIREILHNALKHSPPNSTIEITTERIDDYLSLQVKDKGHGFSEIVLKNLFKIFIRDQETADQSFGLNLALVKLVIDLHDGRVEVDNLPEGGARVTLSLKAFKPVAASLP